MDEDRAAADALEEKSGSVEAVLSATRTDFLHEVRRRVGAEAVPSEPVQWDVLGIFRRYVHLNEIKLESYNDLVKRGLRDIYTNQPPLMVSFSPYHHVFRVLDVSLNKPVYTDPDGMTRPLLPHLCRLLGLTYGSDLYGHLQYDVYHLPTPTATMQWDDVQRMGTQISSCQIPFVRLVTSWPVMVGSVLCHLSDGDPSGRAEYKKNWEARCQRIEEAADRQRLEAARPLDLPPEERDAAVKLEAAAKKKSDDAELKAAAAASEKQKNKETRESKSADDADPAGSTLVDKDRQRRDQRRRARYDERQRGGSQLSECPHDSGAYFIVKGAEKTLMFRPRLTFNVPFCLPGKTATYPYKVEVRCEQEGKFRSTSTLYMHLSNRQMDNGCGLYVELPWAKQHYVPLVVLLRGLGCTTDLDFYCNFRYAVGERRWRSNPAFARFFFAAVTCNRARLPKSQQAALVYIGQACAEKKSEKFERTALNKLCKEVLPNVGFTPKQFPHKVLVLCDMAARLVEYAGNPKKYGTNRDSLLHQCSEHPHELMGNLTKQELNEWAQAVRQRLINTLGRSEPVDVYEAFRDNWVGDDLCMAISTGKWVVHRRFKGGGAGAGGGGAGMAMMGGGAAQNGVAQAMQRNNLSTVTAQNTKFVSKMHKEGKHVDPRLVHNTSYGVTCPADSPEGPPCGLVKHGSIVSTITPGTTPHASRMLLRRWGVTTFASFLDTPEALARMLRETVSADASAPVAELGDRERVHVSVNGTWDGVFPASCEVRIAQHLVDGGDGAREEQDATDSKTGGGGARGQRLSADASATLRNVHGAHYLAWKVRQARRRLTLGPFTGVWYSLERCEFEVRTNRSRNARPLFIVENMGMLGDIDLARTEWDMLLYLGLAEWVDKKEEDCDDVVIAEDAAHLRRLMQQWRDCTDVIAAAGGRAKAASERDRLRATQPSRALAELSRRLSAGSKRAQELLQVLRQASRCRAFLLSPKAPVAAAAEAAHVRAVRDVLSSSQVGEEKEKEKEKKQGNNDDDGDTPEWRAFWLGRIETLLAESEAELASIGSTDSELRRSIAEKEVVVERLQDLSEALEHTRKREQPSHCELHGSVFWGVIANSVPFANHNQSPRNTYATAMIRHAIGALSGNALNRFDSTTHELWYPEPSMVATRHSRMLGLDRLPSGQQVVLAIMSARGHNQEDSWVMNRAAVDRGLGRSTQYKTVTFSETVLGKGPDDRDAFRRLREGQCINRKSDTDDSGVDEDGILPPGSRVLNRTVLATRGRPIVLGQPASAPRRRGGENGDGDGEGDDDEEDELLYEDTSIIAHVSNETSTVDKVMITQGAEGRSVKMSVRTVLHPRLGDKFSSRHGQKGTVGCMYNPEDMPFAQDGTCPDVLMNGIALVSRQTYGQIIEMMLGIVCALTGHLGDATACSDNYMECLDAALRDCLKREFLIGAVGCGVSPTSARSALPTRAIDCGHDAVSRIGRVLCALGVPSMGHSVMYSGLTGKRLEGRIFTGVVDWLKLRHLVTNKVRGRSTGGHNPTTGQPKEGRENNGGLKFGEMERDCVIAHGAASATIDAMRNRSDPSSLHVCRHCHSESIYIPSLDEDWCPRCHRTNAAELVATTRSWRAFKQETQAIGIGLRLRTRPMSGVNSAPA